MTVKEKEVHSLGRPAYFGNSSCAVAGYCTISYCNNAAVDNRSWDEQCKNPVAHTSAQNERPLAENCSPKTGKFQIFAKLLGCNKKDVAKILLYSMYCDIHVL